MKQPFIIAAAVVAALITIPLLGVAYYIYIDTCSMPLWVTPSVIRKAITQNVQLDAGEHIILVNIDAFDYDHINVLTNKKVCYLSDHKNPGVKHEIPYSDIAEIYRDEKDTRYIFIKDTRGVVKELFFVGSTSGYYKRLMQEWKASREN